MKRKSQFGDVHLNEKFRDTTGRIWVKVKMRGLENAVKRRVRPDGSIFEVRATFSEDCPVVRIPK